MILDGGFWSEECLSSLHALCDAFTVGLPAHLQICAWKSVKSADSFIEEGDFIEPLRNEEVCSKLKRE
jgi:hypothetical protein